jgi:hypothetical protein
MLSAFIDFFRAAVAHVFTLIAGVALVVLTDLVRTYYDQT